jgi:hypothetical protein
MLHGCTDNWMCDNPDFRAMVAGLKGNPRSAGKIRHCILLRVQIDFK